MAEPTAAARSPTRCAARARARRVRVNVHEHSGVEVVLPLRAPERAADAAVSELAPWIERRLGEVRRARALIASRGGRCPTWAVPCGWCPRPAAFVCTATASACSCRAARRVPRSSASTAAARAARSLQRLDAATARVGLSYRGLSIRAQRTRWASCTERGSMSFNWRLLLAPERVLQYVIWHEVCHLEILDHSQRFWRLLESRWPGYHEERDWLTRNGATLVI